MSIDQVTYHVVLSIVSKGFSAKIWGKGDWNSSDGWVLEPRRDDQSSKEGLSWGWTRLKGGHVLKPEGFGWSEVDFWFEEIAELYYYRTNLRFVAAYITVYSCIIVERILGGGRQLP